MLLSQFQVNFPSNSKRDAPFHRIVYDYSRADWEGFRDHLRDVLENCGLFSDFQFGFRSSELQMF